MVEGAMNQGTDRQRGECRRPEHGDGPGVGDPKEPVHDHRRRPLARQIGARRRAEHGQIVHEIAEAIGAGQPLRTDQPQHEDEQPDAANRDETQQLARAPRRKHVDQRDGDDRPHNRRNGGGTARTPRHK